MATNKAEVAKDIMTEISDEEFAEKRSCLKRRLQSMKQQIRTKQRVSKSKRADAAGRIEEAEEKEKQASLIESRINSVLGLGVVEALEKLDEYRRIDLEEEDKEGSVKKLRRKPKFKEEDYCELCGELEEDCDC